jgi:hypothetical protein
MDASKSRIGVLMTLDEPTWPMLANAASVGMGIDTGRASGAKSDMVRESVLASEAA